MKKQTTTKMMSSIGSTKKIDLLHYDIFAQFNEITHFTTTRSGGVSHDLFSSLNLSTLSGDSTESVTINRQILCDSIGIDLGQLIIPRQTHDDQIAIIDQSFLQHPKDKQPEYLDGKDALITSLSGVCIGVTTADCVPILLFDPVNKVVAAIHAGWRGTVKRIASKTIIQMENRFGCKPRDIFAIIGPSIGPEAFEVGTEVVDEFRKNNFHSSILTNYEKPHINLWEANKQDMIEIGVSSERIEISAICTYKENERYFSARRLGIHSGRCVTAIMIK